MSDPTPPPVLLDVATVRPFLVATSLDDPSIQLLINEALADILEAAGPINQRIFEVAGRAHAIYFPGKWASIDKVEEANWEDTVWTEVPLQTDNDAGGYYIAADGQLLYRKSIPGTIFWNVAFNRPVLYDVWAHRVRITATPQDDSDQRKACAIKLVVLAEGYDGLKSSNIGGYGQTSQDYTTEKRKLLNKLTRHHRLRFA
jgi:hypothetical protein